MYYAIFDSCIVELSHCIECALCAEWKIRDCMTAFSSTCDAVWKWEPRPLINLIAHLSLNTLVKHADSRSTKLCTFIYTIRQLYFDIKWCVKQKREYSQVCFSNFAIFSLFYQRSAVMMSDQVDAAAVRLVRTHSCVHARPCPWLYQTSYDTTSFCVTLRRFNTRWAYERNARIIDRRIVVWLVTASGRGKYSMWRACSSASLGTWGMIFG